jgi:hypothetical protein
MLKFKLKIHTQDGSLQFYRRSPEDTRKEVSF